MRMQSNYTPLKSNATKDIRQGQRLGQRQDSGRERPLLIEFNNNTTIEFHDRTVKNIIK